MKSNSNHSFERSVLKGVRIDCKTWRQLVMQCTRTDELATPPIEERYKTVHSQILTSCRDIAAHEQVSESRRRLARQLDELLRPWSSTRLFKDAPPHLVHNLLKSQANIEELLRNETRGFSAEQLKQVVLTACIAGVAGILIVFLLQSISGSVFTPPFQFLEGLVASVTAYLGKTTFTEQVAIAVLAAWLFGTWLMSRIYSG